MREFGAGLECHGPDCTPVSVPARGRPSGIWVFRNRSSALCGRTTSSWVRRNSDVHLSSSGGGCFLPGGGMAHVRHARIRCLFPSARATRRVPGRCTHALESREASTGPALSREIVSDDSRGHGLDHSNLAMILLLTVRPAPIACFFVTRAIRADVLTCATSVSPESHSASHMRSSHARHRQAPRSPVESAVMTHVSHGSGHRIAATILLPTMRQRPRACFFVTCATLVCATAVFPGELIQPHACDRITRATERPRAQPWN